MQNIGHIMLVQKQLIDIERRNHGLYNLQVGILLVGCIWISYAETVQVVVIICAQSFFDIIKWFIDYYFNIHKRMQHMTSTNTSFILETVKTSLYKNIVPTFIKNEENKNYLWYSHKAVALNSMNTIFTAIFGVPLDKNQLFVQNYIDAII